MSIDLKFFFFAPPQKPDPLGRCRHPRTLEIASESPGVDIHFAQHVCRRILWCFDCGTALLFRPPEDVGAPAPDDPTATTLR